MADRTSSEVAAAQVALGRRSEKGGASTQKVGFVPYRGADRPIRADVTAIHPGSIEGQGERTVAVNRHHPTPAAEFSQRLDNRLCGLVQRLVGVAQPRGDFEGRAVANKELAVAGRRYRTGRVVRIGAGADDRAVADPAGGFARHPTRRGSSGEIAVTVAGNGTDGALLGYVTSAL